MFDLNAVNLRNIRLANLSLLHLRGLQRRLRSIQNNEQSRNCKTIGDKPISFEISIYPEIVLVSTSCLLVDINFGQLCLD